MSTKQYYKKKLVNQNIEVEYSSETDEITIQIERKLVMGAHLGYDYLKIHPSYIEPLYKLLKAVTEVSDLPTEDSKPNAGHSEAQDNTNLSEESR